MRSRMDPYDAVSRQREQEDEEAEEEIDPLVEEQVSEKLNELGFMFDFVLVTPVQTGART